MRDVFIPERKGIKDALAARRRIPPDLENYFAELWDEIEPRLTEIEKAPKIEATSPEACRSEYENLWEDYKTKGFAAVNDFVFSHSTVHLDKFIKTNSLAIPTKASKATIEQNLLAHFAERKIITRQ